MLFQVSGFDFFGTQIEEMVIFLKICFIRLSLRAKSRTNEKVFTQSLLRLFDNARVT